MKAKEYHVLDFAVRQGVMWGWIHAHKHDPEPDAEAIKDRIADDVLSEVCEWFTFDDEVPSTTELL